ncbi:MAG: PIN domain-containing protein [Porphyromonadaceae bacterium]|nr:PIN domain-containing protein [Porphyromonadaceae bacterium]
MKNLTITNDKIAIDTNILIYAIGNQDIAKSEISMKILEQKPYVSNQVITETINVLMNNKFNKNKFECFSIALDILEFCPLIHNTKDTYYSSQYLLKKYKLGPYDAIIIANALLEGCKLLYSEDIHKYFIEKRLKIINPFNVAHI